MSLCVVVLRHVNNEVTNRMWIESCTNARKHYPEATLVLIDDNSDEVHVSVTASEMIAMKFYDIVFIRSEYPKHGELLPYIYFLKHRWADAMLFIHDSVFVQKRVDIPTKHTWYSCWNAVHCFSNTVHPDTIRMMNRLLRSDELIGIFKNKRSSWSVCYGAMGYITHDALHHLEKTYKLTNLLGHVLRREDRYCLERLFACMYYDQHKTRMPYLIHKSITVYQRWGTTYETYSKEKHKQTLSARFPFFKVWVGR